MVWSTMRLWNLLTTGCILLLPVHAFIAPKAKPSTSWRPTKMDQRQFLAKKNIPVFDLDAIEAFEATLDASDQTTDDLVDETNDSLGEEVVDVKVFIIPESLNNKRIDAAIAALMDDASSRSTCGTLVTEGRVVDVSTKQSLKRKAIKVATGQTIEVRLPIERTLTEVIAQDIPLDILFEDEHMIVLNKAANMVVHPGAGNWDGTVVNALSYYLQNSSPFGAGDCLSAVDEATSFRPGIVHRLDKGTTGVLVVAKTKQALTALSQQFADRKVKKSYLAITVGNPGKRVAIDKPIGRHPVYRQRMRVVPDPHQKDSSGMTPQDREKMKSSSLSQRGRRALSFVSTLAFDGRLSMVQVRIETGRTHQIRVHLQDRHTPIYGDDVYGLADWNKRLMKQHKIERPLLHAFKLQVEHPITKETMVFQAPLAEDMSRIAKAIYPQGLEDMSAMFGGVDYEPFTVLCG